MKKIIRITLGSTFLFFILSFVTISPFQFKLLPTTSGIHFSIRHLGIADFYGSFTEFNTKITATSDQFTDAKIEFSAKSGSIQTFIEERDHHLRSSDFLDAEKFPEMKFVSTEIKKGKKGVLLVKGDFTLHGVTKPIEINAIVTGKNVDAKDKSEVYGIKFTGSVLRSDFEVGTNYPETLLSNEVKFEANLEFKKELN